MAYTVKDIAWGPGGTSAAPTGGVWSLLAKRGDLLESGIYEWIYNACLEMSRDFRFPLLERTGPLFTLTGGVYSYDPLVLIQPEDSGRIVNLIPNWFRFFNPYTPSSSTISNTGSNFKWKTIDALELMFQTPGIPTYFTRYNEQFLCAPVPDTSYVTYLRYQVEHPFSAYGGISAGENDPIMFPNDWKVILEYWAAMEGATALRMLDYSGDFHTKLFGDPEFQRTSGGKGNPGLVFRKVSQMETDSTSMMRSIRVNVPWMR